MAKPYTITITNGQGQANVLNGSYTVTSNTTGYDNTSINPNSVNVIEGTLEYQFTISATGTLIFHVSETGQSDGVAIVGAKFVRCDSSGNTYGSEIETDSSGIARLLNVPYDSTNAPTIYYKQISSDSEHEFDSSLKSITLDSESKTVEVMNAPPGLKTFKLFDANYSGLAVESGSITLN